MNAVNLIGLAMILLGVGAAIIYFLKKAKFMRQNEHGREVFSDFDEKLLIGMREGAAGFLGRFCITFGTLSLMVAIGSIAYNIPPLDLIIAMVFRKL